MIGRLADRVRRDALVFKRGGSQREDSPDTGRIPAKTDKRPAPILVAAAVTMPAAVGTAN